MWKCSLAASSSDQTPTPSRRSSGRRPPLWTEWMTHACEKSTFRHTSYAVGHYNSELKSQITVVNLINFKDVSLSSGLSLALIHKLVRTRALFLKSFFCSTLLWLSWWWSHIRYILWTSGFVYVSRSSLRTSRHPSPDKCWVIILTTNTRLTTPMQSRLLEDPRGCRAASAQFPTKTGRDHH